MISNLKTQWCNYIIWPERLMTEEQPFWFTSAFRSSTLVPWWQLSNCPTVTVIKLFHSDSYQTVPQWQLSNCCQRPTAVAVSHECREDNSYQARQLPEKRHHGYSPKCVSTINSSPFNFKARSHLTRHIHSSQHNTNKRVRAEKEDWKPHMKWSHWTYIIYPQWLRSKWLQQMSNRKRKGTMSCM